MSRFGWRERWRYRFDNAMSKGTIALIGLLALASTVLIVVVGVVSVFVSGLDRERYGFGRAMWRAMLRALDPGTMGGDQGNPFFLALMLVVTVGGIFVVATLIGVLNTGLESRLERLRKGRSKVIEHGHIVVLGWSEQIFTIVPELVAANESERDSCITLLAEKDKVEMEEEIRARVGSTGRTRLVCRTGAPHEPADLEIVSPEWAKSVIVLSPEDEDADARVIKTLLALDNRGWQGPEPHVVAAIAKGRNVPVARLAGGDRASVIDADDITARFIVQTARQAGLSVVITDLLDFDGDEIYMHRAPELVGIPYGDVLHAYETATVIGLIARNGSVVLNPPATTRVQPDDRIVVIAEDDSTIRLAGQRPWIAPEAIAPVRPSVAEPERILLLGWNKRTAHVVGLMEQYVAPGSQLQIAAPRPPGDVELDALQGWMESLRVDYKELDITDRAALEALNVGAFDHVIVMADDSLEPHQADTRTLMTLLQLRDMQSQLGERYLVVSEMNDERNRELAQVAKADDFVVSGKLISLLMSQLAENRHLSAVLGQLFAASGSEIHLRSAKDYVRTGAWMNFATVVEAARARGETAIGYRLQARAQEPPGYGIKLNPSKGNPLVLEPGDRVIVLADE